MCDVTGGTVCTECHILSQAYLPGCYNSAQSGCDCADLVCSRSTMHSTRLYTRLMSVN